MKRLTLGTRACTEILALLIHVAWADGQLAEQEKNGVRAASGIFSLSKEQRARLDQALEAPLPLDQILIEALTAHERSYAYVAAVWMTGVDADVDPKEQAALDEVASHLGLDTDRRTELTAIARDLLELHSGKADWAADLATLFQSIPKRLDVSDAEELEVAFEGD